ncbi:MAG: helix-turn-helix domain-containing protein [Pseudomonadota bacterium]
MIRRHAPVPLDKCGAALAAEILADRWTLLIIREAFYGVSRYDDIRADIGIPRSVLTARLKTLVAADILKRVPYQDKGARTRHCYVLSEKGQALGLTMLALMQWGDDYLKDGIPALAVTHRETGRPLRVGLVSDPDVDVPLSSVRIKPLP